MRWAPVIDTFHPTPVRELDQLHMDPDGPVPAVGDGVMLAELTEETVEAFVGAAGPDSGSALLMAEIRHLGGAVARPVEGGGVVSHFDAGYLVFAGGMAMSPEMAAAGHASLRVLTDALAPWTATEMYLNFAEAAVASETIWGSDIDRLRAIKVVYDPQGTIRSNHAL